MADPGLDPSAADQEQMRRAAAYWAKTWAGLQDQAPLIEDVEMAGWIAWIEYQDRPARQWYEVQNAMQDAISYWLYGVSRGQRPRQWTPGGSLDRLAAAQPNLEAEVFRRIGLRRLWEALTPHDGNARRSKAQRVLCLMADTGLSWNIARDVSREYGIGERAMYNGKKKIRAMAHAHGLGGHEVLPSCPRPAARCVRHGSSQ